MLFGHDDTVWLLDNVIKMLGGLDPDLPYLITDNIWFGVNGSGKLSWLAVTQRPSRSANSSSWKLWMVLLPDLRSSPVC